MTNDIIEKFIESSSRRDALVYIHFKDRNRVSGRFVQYPDYAELKSKNFWRIVNSSHLDEWESTKDINLTRLFHGMSFTKLTDQ